ncbi:hypothetical protein BZL41_08395 [Pseudomonas sp. PIC25]|nr:hypothetical protein BZL41_08395 [Pseudomonas sp. PIC25]
MLHQGTPLIPADFIVPVSSYNPVVDHHQWLFANCLSQSQALTRSGRGLKRPRAAGPVPVRTPVAATDRASVSRPPRFAER